MGNVAFVCISKNKPLNPYLVILYKIVGSSPPHLCKKIRPVATAELVVGDIRISDMYLEIPQLKSMGNTPFGRFFAIKPQTPSPVILYQFVAA